MYHRELTPTARSELLLFAGSHFLPRAPSGLIPVYPASNEASYTTLLHFHHNLKQQKQQYISTQFLSVFFTRASGGGRGVERKPRQKTTKEEEGVMWSRAREVDRKETAQQSKEHVAEKKRNEKRVKAAVEDREN